MRIDRVSVENYCQHAKRDDIFGAGSHVLVGPNGSGKTNYLHAIKRAFTGQTENEGKNEDDLKWETEKGYIEVEFSVGSYKGIVHRDLKTSRCRMEYDGKEYITATTIDEVVYKILGVTPKVLSDMVFVPQGKIDALLTMQPADRTRSFQIMFGTEIAEYLRGIVQTESQGVLVTDRSQAIRELQDKLSTQYDKPVQDAKEELERTKPQILDQAALTQLTNLSYRRNEYLKRKKLFEQANNLVAQYTPLIEKTKAQYEESKAISDELSNGLAALKADYEAAWNRVSRYDSDLATRTRWDQQQRNYNTYIEALKASEPIKPVVDSDRAGLQEAFSKADHEYRISAAIGQLHKGTPCPSCQQPVDSDHISFHAARSNELYTKRNELSVALQNHDTALSKWIGQKATWDRDQTAYKAEVLALKAIIDAEPPSLPSPATLAADKAFMVDYKALMNESEASNNETRGKKSTLDNYETSLKCRAIEADTLKKTLGDPITEDQVADALVKIAHNTVCTNRVTELQGKIDILTRQRAESVKMLEQYKAEEQKTEKKKGWRNTLDRVRMVLHRDQLPNVVAQSYVRALNSKLAKYLEIFEVPFTARIQPDLSIECSFGSRLVSSGRLSGGQRVALGIAFHLAKHDLFASSLGLLVLDEPTVFLDDDRIDCMFNILEKVKSYSRGAGLQLIVVTHEARLMGCFDNVIRL